MNDSSRPDYRRDDSPSYNRTADIAIALSVGLLAGVECVGLGSVLLLFVAHFSPDWVTWPIDAIEPNSLVNQSRI